MERTTTTGGRCLNDGPGVARMDAVRPELAWSVLNGNCASEPGDGGGAGQWVMVSAMTGGGGN